MAPQFASGDRAVVNHTGEGVTVLSQSGQSVLVRRSAWSGGSQWTYSADRLRRPGTCPATRQ